MATKKKEAKTINTSEDREKALSEALAQIQKQFGKGAVMKLGDDNPMMNIEAISTGSMSLDLATGIGGVPRGRITEVFGPESSGKNNADAACDRRSFRRLVAGLLSSMQSMHWIRNTPEIWALTWMNCWYLSRITANRLWKLQKCWFVAAPSIWWW